MFQKNFIVRGIVTLFCAVLLVTVIPVSAGETVYAASVSTFSSTKKAIVCGKSAKIKVPSGYKNCKFSSSNKKVATVNSKGVVKAVRLGVAKITVKSGKKKKVYTITVKPAKASEVWLNQEAVLTGQKLTFSLASDKYDTSQVKLTFSSSESAISSSGKCSGISGSGARTGSLTYSYGLFSKTGTLQIYSPDWIYTAVLGGSVDGTNLYAGTSYAENITSADGKINTVSQMREKGISVLLDGAAMPDSMTLTAGTHTIAIVSGTAKYEKTITVSYTVKDALINRNATGFREEAKAVFDAAFAVLDQIITDGMSDEQKVRAIHDYLIYHADYVNNGDYTTAANWAFGATGVLQYGEGVCQSYAIAFYMMTTACGIPCEYVTSATHAWNRVYLNGVWYYIDCTFDDPVPGGYENYDYYLSTTGWYDSDHVIQSITDLADDGKYAWEYYYLTGESYVLVWAAK